MPKKSRLRKWSGIGMPDSSGRTKRGFVGTGMRGIRKPRRRKRVRIKR